MSSRPVITAEIRAPHWTNIASAPPLPERMPSASALAGAPATSTSDREPAAPRTLWRSTLRWVRDATIGLALIMSLPLAMVGVVGNKLSGFRATDLAARIAQVEPTRALRLPTTNELTPLAAGELWHAMSTGSGSDEFPTRPVASPIERAWAHSTLTDEMFVGIPRTNGRFLQGAALLHAAAAGFSDTELAYLRTVANDELWRDFDRLASADAVDLLGGRFVLPFRDDASPTALPLPRFADTKELAYAGVARAAYHMAQGEPKRAEHALRAVVSFGFMLLDNGTTAIEGLIGRVIVGIGRDGLHAFYTITGDAERAAMTAPLAEAGARGRATIGARTEAEQIAIAGDPTMPRTIRLESLHALAYSSCTSVRSVLFGPSADAIAAFDDARRTLARFPSERALLDMLQDLPNRPPDDPVFTPISPGVLLGAATVASTVTGNPRFQTCTMLLGTNF
jgi:hypothetical protein